MTDIIHYGTKDVRHRLRLRHDDGGDLIIQESYEFIGGQYWVFEPVDYAGDTPAFRQLRPVSDDTDLEWNARPNVHRRFRYMKLIDTFLCTIATPYGCHQLHTVKLIDDGRRLELKVNGPQEVIRSEVPVIFRKLDRA